MILASTFMTMGQNNQSPKLFRNQAEYVQYMLDHPDQLVLNANNHSRAASGYSQKLDSVIGADDFDWTRWKNEYTYATIDNGQQYSDRLRVETSYQWKSDAWEPEVRTSFLAEGDDTETLIAYWNGEQWEDRSRVTYHYESFDGEVLLESVTSMVYADSVWTMNTKSSYEYDSLNHLVLNQNYVYDEEVEGGWRANSKNEYTYDGEGALLTKLYSTIRNGNWRQSSLDTLSYDESHRCVELLTRTKGGFGPGANQWRNSSKYEFTYIDDQLVSELHYTASWFSSEMNLNNKTDYQFDAQGNLLRKTTSVYNGQDWNVRDEYENTFDPSAEVSTVLGIRPLWESYVNKGMGYVLGADMTLNNQWKSCIVTSTSLDTQFDLYYSGFAAVEETHDATLMVLVKNGTLVVENTSPSDVVVYDLLGRVVASKDHILRQEFSLKPGLYLVSNGVSVVKTVVK